MRTPRASASTSSGCAYSRSIPVADPAQLREVTQVLRLGGSAGYPMHLIDA